MSNCIDKQHSVVRGLGEKPLTQHACRFKHKNSRGWMAAIGTAILRVDERTRLMGKHEEMRAALAVEKPHCDERCPGRSVHRSAAYRPSIDRFPVAWIVRQSIPLRLAQPSEPSALSRTFLLGPVSAGVDEIEFCQNLYLELSDGGSN